MELFYDFLRKCVLLQPLPEARCWVLETPNSQCMEIVCMECAKVYDEKARGCCVILCTLSVQPFRDRARENEGV